MFLCMTGMLLKKNSNKTALVSILWNDSEQLLLQVAVFVIWKYLLLRIFCEIYTVKLYIDRKNCFLGDPVAVSKIKEILYKVEQY